MAIISSNSFTFLTILFCLTNFHSSALSSQAIVASDQLKFWSKNVQNKMPKSILTKLSPLNKHDSDYYSNILSKNGENFSADANFCSLAKLACSSSKLANASNTFLHKHVVVSQVNLHQVMKNEDPFSLFRLSVLKNGNLIRLPNLQQSFPARAFLPSQIASKISLNYDTIAKIFPDSANGTAKEAILTNLAYCNAAAIEGETKSCPKSLEEMVAFVKSTLGEKKLLALTSKNIKGSNTEVVVRNIKQYSAEKIVGCHEAFLPFAAYYCHFLPSTRLYEVEFVDNTMFAACHMDTSAWPKNHVAFEILKFGPGEGEACHWYSQFDLAWIGNESSHQSV